MILTRLWKGAAALLGLASAGCASVPSEAAPAVRPALWRVSDQDTTIYLFGTIHMLPTNYQWRTQTFDQAIAQSQVLVVETILDESNPQALAMHLARMGFAKGLPPLAERVSQEKRALLEQAIKKTGVPRALFDNMETWAAALMLLGPQFQSLGLSGGDGVESVLKKTFKEAGKPIDQLESNVDQLSLFDALPEKAQRALLEGSIEAPTEMRSQFNTMLSAWARGDVDAIAKSFNDNLAESPELKDALLKKRNANWSRWIARRMAQPGTIFVAVGAGHLAGDSSVQQMLSRSGYRVKRVQ